MMNFERGKDIKDAAQIGRRKDAIEVIRIDCHSNNQVIQIVEPYTIRKFLEAFCGYTMQRDPVFGTHRIILCSGNSEFAGPGYGSSWNGARKYFTNDCATIYELPDFAGKTAMVGDKFFQLPTLDELKAHGYAYLVEYLILREVEKEAERVQRAQHKILTNSAYGVLTSSNFSGSLGGWNIENIDPINLEQPRPDTEIKKPAKTSNFRKFCDRIRRDIIVYK
jgi:hypothetical protein